MNTERTQRVTTRTGGAVAAAGRLAAIVAGAACIGPMIGIVFGIGGLGWLARYAHVRVPASVVTLLLLAIGYFLLYWRRDGSCAAGRRRARTLLWIAAVAAAAINSFEYPVLPTLG